MKSKRAFRIVRNVLLAIVFLTGLILISTNFIKNHIRKQVSVTAIEAVESVIDDGGGEITIEVPAVDFLKVDGENGEEDKSLEELIREMQSLSAEHESLKLLGILEIPCIDLKEPIWDSCSSTALRYGVGRFPQTCNIGEPMNCMPLDTEWRVIRSSGIFRISRTISVKKSSSLLPTASDTITRSTLPLM